jgi:hypothetical protein
MTNGHNIEQTITLLQTNDHVEHIDTSIVY